MSSPYDTSGDDPQRGQQPSYGGFHSQQPYGQPDPRQGQSYGARPGQYGGQPYGGPYGQQYGQPGQPWQYPQSGAVYGQPAPPQSPPSSAPEKRPARSVLPWILLVVGVLVVAGGVVAVLAATGMLGKTTFDNVAVQDGVRKVLTEDYNKNVGAVSCPAGEEVKTGRTFNCVATVDGQERQVTITVKTDSGEYEVGEPK
jgi:Domain of unknown function (DUF4333)